MSDVKEKAKVVSAAITTVAACAAGSVATKLVKEHVPVPDSLLSKAMTKLGIWAISLGIGKMAGKAVMDEVDSVMDILVPMIEATQKKGGVPKVEVVPCENKEEANESV